MFVCLLFICFLFVCLFVCLFSWLVGWLRWFLYGGGEDEERPVRVGHIRFRKVTEVKQRWARSVLGWVTAGPGIMVELTARLVIGRGRVG